MAFLTSLLLIISANVFVDCQNLTANALIRSQVGLESNAHRLLLAPLGFHQTYTTVSDYASIDLDQDAIEDELDRESDEGFKNARLIYEQGGHSKPYATIALDEVPVTPVAKGTFLMGHDCSGNTVIGKSYYTTGQDNLLTVRYESKDGLEGAYPGCNVGALTSIEKEQTDGCFAKSGVLEATIDGRIVAFGYTYDVLTNTKNGRTIKGFSTSLKKDMLECDGCLYPDAKYAAAYYETPSYGNEWIEAAFEKRPTSFKRGNADFSDYGYVGRAEAIKVGAVAMNILMYSLRELEDAIRDCEASSLQSLRNWDEGAALYYGSLEEAKLGSSALKGKLLHHIADRYCPIFNTCGLDRPGWENTGMSAVNHWMMVFFARGHSHLVLFECEAARKVKEKIADMMYVPLIQGTLDAAYRVEYLDGYQRFQARGAAFAAAVLPKVYAVNKDAAKVIYENMRVGAPETSHRAVKDAFQSVYKDMNIDCGHVGGMWDKSLGIYYKDGSPCLQSKSTTMALILTGVMLSISFGLTGAIFYRRDRSNVIDLPEVL